jgi:hypothetical protein
VPPRRGIVLDPNKSNAVKIEFKIDPWVHEALRRYAWDRGIHINGLMRDILGMVAATAPDFSDPDFWEPQWPQLDLPPERYLGYRQDLLPRSCRGN